MPQGLPDSFKPIGSQPDNDTGLPASFKPVQPAETIQGPPPQNPGFLSQAWHMAADPLWEGPTRVAKRFSDYMTDPNQAMFHMLPTGQGGMHDAVARGLAELRGTVAGATEGAGNVISSFTSPLSLATYGLGAGETAAARAGLPEIAQLANIGKRVAGAPYVAHGAINLLHPDSSLEERAMGLTEMAGGAAGMMHTPEMGEVPIRQPKPNIPEMNPELADMHPDEVANFNRYLQEIQPQEHRVSNEPDLTTGRARNLPAEFATPEEEDIFNARRAENVPKFQPKSLLDRADDFFNMGRPLPEGNVESETKIPDFTGNLPPQQDEPQEMKVPGTKGKSGIENVAMGGASPRVLDVLGTSLYSRSRPGVVTKELLQNAFDEHRIAGVTDPVRVLINHYAKNPIDGKSDTKSITVRDRGRGLTPDQLHTVFSDVGESGKAGIDSASGGFGFAKAAPFLGGKAVEVRSVVDTPNGRMRYSFAGTPEQLKNQKVGVPINAERVDAKIPTGLEVTTHFDRDVHGFYDAEDLAKNMTERSPSITSDTLLGTSYGGDEQHQREFLDESPTNPKSSYNHVANEAKHYTRQTVPPLQDTMSVPGADISIHYEEPEKGSQASGYNLHMLNKGLYQQSGTGMYSMEPIPNVPHSIIADIKATVEEGDPSGNYPFTANREQIHQNVTKAINKWIADNIVSGAQKKRIAELQKMYDDIDLLHPEGQTGIHYLDEGSRLNPEEIQYIADSPEMTRALGVLEEVHKQILDVADTLGWMKKPSSRLKKFGLLFQAPNEKGTTLGIHIPRADDPNDSAILVNLMEHLNRAMGRGMKGIPPSLSELGRGVRDPLDRLATGLFTTLTHEYAHIPGGGHDTGFAYRHAQLLEAIGRKDTNKFLDALGGAFDDGSGQVNPEIHQLLQVYNESRGREASGSDAILATGVNQQEPPNTTRPEEANVRGDDESGTEPRNTPRGIVDPYAKYRQVPVGTKYKITPENMNRQKMMDAIKLGFKYDGLDDQGRIVMNKVRPSPMPQQMNSPLLQRSALADVANLPRTIMASMDTSAPLRQGLGLIHKTAFWKALPTMFKSFGSQEVYDGAMNAIAEKPLFRQTVGANGKIQPSFAERAGLKLTNMVNNREEALMSSLLDKVPGFSGSERAYTIFLNKLRADTFEQMTKDYGVFAKEQQPNMAVAKQIAEFVNNASGRGSLTATVPFTGRQLSLERSANALSTVLFSPRLIASRLQMMGRGGRALFDPEVYMSRSPNIRREYLKSLMAIAATTGTFVGLMKGLGGATVESDPASADFGKVKMGNTRIDPYGGFQQYIVLAQRLMPNIDLSSMGLDKINDMLSGSTGGMMKSTVSEKKYSLSDPAFGRSNRMDILEKFIRSKTNPIINFGWGLLAGMREAGGKPMQLGYNPDRNPVQNLYENSITQRFLPMLTQDIYDLVNDETTTPQEKALATFMGSMGAGVQTYGNERQR